MGNYTTEIPTLISSSLGVSGVNLTYEMNPTHSPVIDPNLLRILALLHGYYQPAIMALGLLLNLATFAILMGTKLSSFSSTRYLAACTFNDLIFLLILLITWLNERGFPLYRLGALCHVTTFFLDSSSFLCTWYTVCYSVDRFLSTCLPGWEKQLCTTAKANIVIISIAILALVVFLNISLTYMVVPIGTQLACLPSQKFKHALRTLKQIHMFMNIVIPYILIVIIWVTCSIWCFMDRRLVARRPMVTRNRVTLDQNSLGEGQNTIYLVYVAIFLLSTSPMQIEQCRQTWKGITHPNTPDNFLSVLLARLLNYPYYTRSCLTFVICLAAYRGFRSVLAKCMRNLLKRLRELIRRSRVSKIQDGGISLEDFQEEEESRIALCGNSPSKRDCVEL